FSDDVVQLLTLWFLLIRVLFILLFRWHRFSQMVIREVRQSRRRREDEGFMGTGFCSSFNFSPSAPASDEEIINATARPDHHKSGSLSLAGITVNGGVVHRLPALRVPVNPDRPPVHEW